MKIRKYHNLLLAFAAALACAGCGETSSGPALHPVSGVVTKGGAPLSGAVVTLYATDPQMLKSGVPTPKGLTDGQGAFELRTFDPGDGARVGEYALTIRQVESVDAPDGQLIERDLLKGAYANQAKPFKVVQVTEGANDLGVIDLP